MTDGGADYLVAIKQRASVRSFKDCPVEELLLMRLLDLSTKVRRLTELSPRIALVRGAEQAQRIVSYVIGSYGLVLNPPHLLVGVLPEESEAARLELGYMLEQLVLEATRLGLGTCWVTGSYHPQRAGEAAGLAPGQVAAAVCALGYPVATGWLGVHSRTVRRLARGHRRKPLAEITFSGRWEQPWSPDAADPTVVALLEYARLAPSATNRQPWRFIVQPDRIVLALIRPAPIDAGIVMSHVTLAADAVGHAGRWQVRLGDAALAQDCRLPRGVFPVATFQ